MSVYRYLDIATDGWRVRAAAAYEPIFGNRVARKLWIDLVVFDKRAGGLKSFGPSPRMISLSF